MSKHKAKMPSSSVRLQGELLSATLTSVCRSHCRLRLPYRDAVAPANGPTNNDPRSASSKAIPFFSRKLLMATS